MCLIVFKEDNKSTFTNRQFKYMIARNDDGLGIMWRENGRIKWEKSVGTSREKFRMWQTHRNKEQYAMHARYKTHGLVDLNNCHPYEIMNIDKGDPIDLFIMHNGVLHNVKEVNKDMSDTWHYVEYVLKPLCKSNIDLVWDNENIQDMVTKHIGTSKLLLMRSDDVEAPTLIFNESLGTEKDGCWLSNGFSTIPYPVSKVTYHYNNNAYQDRFSRGSSIMDFNGGSTSKTVADQVVDAVKQKETDFDWQGYCANRQSQDKNTTMGPKLYLPDETKDGKIVELFKSNIEDPNGHLKEILVHLRGMSDNAVKLYIKDDPDTIADIIMALYDKNTMSYELIIQQLNSDKGIETTINLLRHMTIEEETKRKNLR